MRLNFANFLRKLFIFKKLTCSKITIFFHKFSSKGVNFHIRSEGVSGRVGSKFHPFSSKIVNLQIKSAPQFRQISSKIAYFQNVVRVMHHRTGHRQVFVGFSGCVWLARNSERSCGGRTSDAQTDTVRTSNSKVMSSLLLVRKCFLASSPLGRHSLELRASVSRVFANRSRLAQDPILYWRSVFAAVFSSSWVFELRPRIALAIYAYISTNHICSASYRN